MRRRNTPANGREIPLSSVVGKAHSMTALCAALCQMERDWGMIVGPSLGRRSYPASYENGVLVVVVDGRSATHDMNFKKNAIIREILVKTGIRINDIRTRMAGSGVDAADRPGASQVRGVARRPFAADEKVVDALKREIISKHAGMDPRLAGAIARCMALRGGFRPGTRS